MSYALIDISLLGPENDVSNLNNCTRSTLVQQSIKNFLLIKTETIDKFLLDIEDIDIPVNSNVMVVTGDFETSVDIWDVHRPSPRSKVMYVKKNFKST